MDIVLGLTMIVTFLIALRQAKHFSIAIASAMIIAFSHCIIWLAFDMYNYKMMIFSLFSLIGLFKTGRIAIQAIENQSEKPKRYYKFNR